MKKLLLLAEQGFTVLALLTFSGGVFQLLYEVRTGQYSGGLDTEGNFDVMLAFFIIYVITFVLVVLRWRRVVHVLPKRKFLLLLVGMALASVVWSVAPDLTIRRSVALSGTTMFGIYFGTRYELQEQYRLLLWTFSLATLLSIALVVCLPSIGIHHTEPHIGLWRGIYTHKNTLGRNMGFSLFMFALLAIWGRKYRWLGCVGCGLAVAMMALSGSVTPVVSTFTVLILLPLYSILRSRYNFTSFIFTIAAVVYAFLSAVLLSLAATLLGLFGRDLSFTGRTPLWSAILEVIPNHLWLGYGYSAFWLSQNSEALQVFRAVKGWRPDYAHNGYLELTLSLGLLGAIVFAIDFLISFFQSFILAAASKEAAGIFPLAFMTYMIPYNMTDSVILSQNNITWVVYVSVAISLLLTPTQIRIRFN